MKGKIARIVAGILAALLVAAYFCLPTKDERMTMSNSGRKKLDVPVGETLTWSWTPSMDNTDGLELKLTGMKKAQGITLNVQLKDESGEVVAENRKAIADLGEDGDGISIPVHPEYGKHYTLAVSAEGEGTTIKLKGAVEDSGEFYPMLKETGSVTKYNPVLLYFAVGLLLLALTPVFGAERKRLPRIKKKITLDTLLPWGTFILILSVGMLVVFHKPAFEPSTEWGSWDEEIHMNAIQAMSLFGDGGLPYWVADMITWNPGYIPLAIGYSIGRIFTRGDATLYLCATFTSVLFYAGMCALAVKHAPRYKVSFLVASTMPTLMFLMTSMSYDTVVSGSIILGLALVLESIEGEESVSPIRAITMTAILAFGTVAKPAYSLAVLALMMIPASKLGGKGKAWMFRGFAILMTVWCMAAAAMPGAYDSVRAGDERFAGASASGQIEYMLSDPLNALMIPFRYLWNNQRFLMNMGIAHWAYLGNSLNVGGLYLAMMLLAAPLCACGEKWDRKSPLSPGRRIGLGAIAFGAEIVLIITQYVVSSEVGGGVQGVQARYFMPCWIALMLAIMAPQAIRKRVGKAGDVLTVAVYVCCFWVNMSYAVNWLTSTGYLG